MMITTKNNSPADKSIPVISTRASSSMESTEHQHNNTKSPETATVALNVRPTVHIEPPPPAHLAGHTAHGVQEHSQPSVDTSTPSTSSHQTKFVPRNYFECPMSDLLRLVSSMLQELVTLNDALPFDSSLLTRFHSRSPPGISIYDYLVRISRFCSLEKSVVLAMIYYIDLLCTTYKTFNINSLTVHRFMITAAMVGSKGLCDTFCTNTHYARVGGLSKVELNLLEVEFLIRVDYRIVPKQELLNQYYERMVTRLKDVYQFTAESKQTTEVSPLSETAEILQASNYSPSISSSNSSSNSSYKSAWTSQLVLPSEIALREGRRNYSSELKRSSVSDLEPDNSDDNQQPQNHSSRPSSRSSSTIPARLSITTPKLASTTPSLRAQSSSTGASAPSAPSAPYGPSSPDPKPTISQATAEQSSLGHSSSMTSDQASSGLKRNKTDIPTQH